MFASQGRPMPGRQERGCRRANARQPRFRMRKRRVAPPGERRHSGEATKLTRNLAPPPTKPQQLELALWAPSAPKPTQSTTCPHALELLRRAPGRSSAVRRCACCGERLGWLGVSQLSQAGVELGALLLDVAPPSRRPR